MYPEEYITSTSPCINLAPKHMIGLYFMKNARTRKHDPLTNIELPNILETNTNFRFNFQ